MFPQAKCVVTGRFRFIAKLQIGQLSPVQSLIGKSGRLYNGMVVRRHSRHTFDSFDVTLAFEYAQVTQPGWDDVRSEDYLRTI